MRKSLLIILFFIAYRCWSQSLGNMITISQVVPSNLTICGDAKLFTITIYNPSPFLINNPTLLVSIPTGIQYQFGSVTGSSGTPSWMGGVLTVPLPNIPTLTTHTVTFTANAQCNVLQYINSGGTIKNIAQVTYTANNIFRYDTNTSSTYLIKQPNLAITSISNQSYVGNIGDVFTRCITVVNGGFGELTTFSMTDIHASGIQIISMDKGVLTQTGLTAKVVLSGTDFMTIGDGDNLFEGGESITICETVKVLDCISAISNFKAFWGCSVNYCQAAISTANVVFPNYVPNLVITPTASMNSCIGTGNASPQQLKIINNGLGKAINIQLNIFQATGGGYNANVGSYIDENSFTKQIGLSGSLTSITPTSTQATANLNCMTNAKGKVTLTIDTIKAGDTLYIKWNSYSCCYNACTNIGKSYINGWRYKGGYSSLCQTNYIIYEAWGRVYSDIYGGLTPDGAPSTLSNGQTGTFNFLFSNYGNTYPVGPGAYWKFEFTLPPHACLSYSNIKIVHNNGTSTWTPNSVTAAGNIVTAIFNTPVPFNLTQAELKINLTLLCLSCTGTEELTALSVKSFYIPNNTCGCEIGVSCQNIPFNINCPDPCPAGILFSNFEMSRTSYGLPDNEAGGGNGIPDGSGSLDFLKIKTNRVMFGDTITSTFYGVVNTSLSHPTLQYGYAISSITNGNLLSFLNSELKIYRGGSLLYTCNNIIPTVSTSGTTRDFSYDISVDTLISKGCLPGGYINTQGDSLVLSCRYKNTINIGNVTPLNCFSTNKFYLSEIANPTLASDKLQCGTINGNCTVIGYWYRNWEADSYGVKSCDNNTISQNYFLSIGPGSTNDAGGNLFPYEYRNWAHIQTLTAIVPFGYTFVSARFKDIRTAGTLVTSNSGWITLSPADSTSDTLAFNIEPYFQGYGGTIPLSDDGFYGVFEVIVQPSCEVTPEIEYYIEHDMSFEVTGYLTGAGADTTFLSRNDDYIVYDAPDLFLQSPLPSILAVDSLETWDLIISNSSNVADAMNTWIGGPTITGVSIVNVVDLGTGLPITPNNDVYPVGTIAAMGTRTFRITAAYTSCNLDSIVVYCGWNCAAGYPDSVSAYPCTPERITLTLTPLMPGFIVDATGPASPIQLCDTAAFIAECANAQLGTAYSVSLIATMPVGTIIIPGSSQLSYPDSASYVTISDPVSLGGNKWQWNISAADSLVNMDGIKGILDTLLNVFKVKFNVATSCGYTSGSNINFNVIGVAVCGDTTDQEIFPSSDLDIIGLSEPYSTAIRIVTTYVSPCATNSVIQLVVHNLGPASSFGNTDSVSFKLPNGVSYVSGSFSGQHNPPPNGVPVLSTISGTNYLTWRLPPGVTVGDSTVFTFQFSGEPVLLACGIVYFDAETRSSNTVVCSATGANCVTNIVTGDTSLAVFIYKAYLGFSNGSAVTVPNPPNGETVTLTYDITNTGQAIAINADSVIQYYFDADGNGIYSLGDIYIAQDTVLVPKDSTITYTTTFDAPAGQACSILAVVDPGINNCVCDPTQIIVQATLSSLGNDTTICSGETMVMSYPPVTGYTYSWTPATDLSSDSISDPLLTASNLTVNPVSTTYMLTTNRINCSSDDTIIITVNPLPTATISGTTIVCKDAPSPEVVFTGAIGPAPYTFTYNINGGINQTAISIDDTAVVSAPTATPGMYVYHLISVQDSSSTACTQLQSDSITITVNPLPTATIALGDVAAVCQGGISPGIVFRGFNGVAPYIFTYTINGGPDQTVSSTSGDSVIVFVPTGVSGVYNYKLVNIQDASITICSQAQSDSISVTVNPLPEAIINGSTAVCREATAPEITIIGTTGTAPFTFTYTINGGATQTINSSSGDTAFIAASTMADGVFYYVLTGATDSSSTTCYQAQNDTVKITVDPLPTATIHGTTTVCQYSQEPGITFVGYGGVEPYTFTYTLNGFVQPTLTTIAGDSITIPAPTNITGIYTYSLVSVLDSNTVACTHPQTGNVIVTINPKPVAAFTTNIVCNGNATQFSDTSSTAYGTITAWTWDLGDSSPLSNAQNPLYIYAGAGIYNVTLLINNSFNCMDTLVQPVQVYFNPIADFTHNDVCLGDTIDFTNTSSVDSSTSIASYIWVFGDGSPTNNQTNPSHYYSGYGTKNVTLVATTIDGCAGVANISVATFDPPASAVQFSDTCLFDSAALANISTDPTMGTISNWSWDFGDGTAIDTNTWSPYHLYAAPGAYEFTLITHSSNLGCPDTLKDSITIYPMPVANYSSVDICLGQTMNFYDSSTVSVNSISDWLWNFGDSSPLDTNQNPTHLFASDTNYNVTLICTTTNGCKDTLTKNVIVHPLPTVDYNTANVCDGSMVYFTDQSTIPNTDTLYSWSWNFGDNSPLSNSQNTSHLYPAAGSYSVLLTVTSTFGCVDSLPDTSIVNPNPNVGFVLSDTAGCEPFCIIFKDTSSIISGINTLWTWNFGDGSPAISGDSISHCYSNDSISLPVFYTTILTVVSDSGCVSTLSKPNNVTVYPKPEADFIVAPLSSSIINPVITITDSSVGTNFWYWDFGDADTSTFPGTELTHEYADTGIYTITLITTTQYGCIDTAYQTVSIEPDFVFYIPSAFSPNADGLNDTFSGKGIFIVKYEMWIFDRWGNLIFYTDDYNKPWDGKANHGKTMAQRDVYVYLINLTDIKQMEHSYKGTVTLIQ